MADRRQAKRPCILSEAELEARRVEYVRRRAAGIAYLRNPLAPGALEEVLRPFQQKHKAATVIQSHVRSRIVRNVCGVCLECERSLALGSSCLDDWPRSRCCYCLRYWQFCKTRGAPTDPFFFLRGVDSEVGPEGWRVYRWSRNRSNTAPTSGSAA